jgi:hypothetical protein
MTVMLQAWRGAAGGHRKTAAEEGMPWISNLDLGGGCWVVDRGIK